MDRTNTKARVCSSALARVVMQRNFLMLLRFHPGRQRGQSCRSTQTAVETATLTSLTCRVNPGQWITSVMSVDPSASLFRAEPPIKQTTDVRPVSSFSHIGGIYCRHTAATLEPLPRGGCDARVLRRRQPLGFQAACNRLRWRIAC